MSLEVARQVEAATAERLERLSEFLRGERWMFGEVTLVCARLLQGELAQSKESWAAPCREEGWVQDQGLALRGALGYEVAKPGTGEFLAVLLAALEQEAYAGLVDPCPCEQCEAQRLLVARERGEEGR